MSQKNRSAPFILYVVWTLFFLFLTLKLVEVGQVAAWSWLWVCMPLIAYYGAILSVLVLIFVAAFVLTLCGVKFNTR
jgi:hypothetical protein